MLILEWGQGRKALLKKISDPQLMLYRCWKDRNSSSKISKEDVIAELVDQKVSLWSLFSKSRVWCTVRFFLWGAEVFNCFREGTYCHTHRIKCQCCKSFHVTIVNCIINFWINLYGWTKHQGHEMALVFPFVCTRFYVVLRIFEFLIFVILSIESLSKTPEPFYGSGFFSIH